jgi:deazaflavin-dependent oxidoreductase (nitroreductase family)
MSGNAAGEYTPRERSRAERIGEAIVASRPGSWWFVNVAPYIDRPLMRLTGGRFTSAGFGRVGILNVRGAKSGTLRETPLLYTRDGDDVLLVASRGGDVKHPAWYRNLVANPDVTFSIRGKERPYVARTTEGDERERAWNLACDRYAGYSVYQRRAGERLIPVVRLEPRAASATASGERNATGTVP